MEAGSSSSAPCIPAQGYNFEVFLSFRGEDTRRTFTDHLYTDLEDRGIHTFRDDDKLPKGEAIKVELLKAINQSKVSVPILSKGYASSKWCLMELAEMVKCMEAGNQKIIPVFYHVDPHEVRHQMKEYAEAFSEHRKKHPSTVVEEWRAALKTVGELKGCTLDDKGYEGKKRIELVLDVLKELKKHQHIDITDNLVGIDDHVDEITDFLDIDVPDIRFGVICGMAGTGKSTIAKFIYNQLMQKFDFCSFLRDISITFKSKGEEFLKAQLVSDIFGHQSENCNPKQSRTKKVLLVLDDVDQTEELGFLYETSDSFPTGSRIIITTRNRNIRKAENVNWIYEVKEMNEENALLLFCKHAFKQDITVPEYDSLSRAIVKAIGGVPLAIEVVASYLSNHLRNKDIWEEELDRLNGDPKIQKTLRVITDSLQREEKEIFFDIACLLHGMDRRILVSLWRAQKLFPVQTIDSLLAKCLIKLTEGNKLWMHNLLRDHGKEVVRAEDRSYAGNRSRLWDSEDGLEVLDYEEQGTTKVQAICLARSTEVEGRRFSGEKFTKLSYLQFLDLGYANLNGGFKRGLPPRLNWISWHGVGDTELTLPLELNLNKLIVLDLSESSIGENWAGWNLIKEAKKLEVLNLKCCQQLRSTPHFNSSQPIKRLIFEDCHELIAVHSSIRQLKTLESLNLKNCRSLKSLPSELGSLVKLTELIIDKVPIERLPEGMTNLETLSAKSCESLTELSLSACESLEELNLSHTSVVQFSVSSRQPKNLQVLDISYSLVSSFPHSLMDSRKLTEINASYCQSLEGGIPSELGSLTCLRILRLDNTGITNIPESIRDLCHLEVLHLGNSMILKTLPELPSSLVSVTVTCRSSVTVITNLSNLINLKELEFIECYKLDKLPKEIKRLSKLRRLKLNWTNVVAFPKEMVKLHQLRELNISNCHKLESLPELPSGLRRLLISHCSSLSELPKLLSLENLRTFSLIDCGNIVEIPNLGELKSLRTLRIRSPLVTIHGLEMLSSLVDLSLRGCAIENSIDFSNLEGISNLEVAFCGKLQKIEGIHSLRRLKRLKILYCETLQELEGIEGLVSLEEFVIYQCPTLENFPALSLMRKLKVLKLQILENHVEMEGLVQLVSLETLVISGCNGVQAIPNLSSLQELKTLQLHGLQRVVEIQGLGELLSLEVLLVSFCDAITTLPSLSKLQKLKSLSLRGLENVSEIEGLSGLVSLESLNISFCYAIRTLPSLLKLKILKSLNLRGLGNVSEIEGLSGLVSLESLNISHCDAVAALPGLSMMQNLRELALHSCRHLSNIQGIAELVMLESLVIQNCKQMENIPALPNFETPDLYLEHGEILRMGEKIGWNYRSIASKYRRSEMPGVGLQRPNASMDSMVREEIITAMELQSPEIITEEFIYKMVFGDKVAIHEGDLKPRALNFVVQRLLKHKGLTIPEISWLITVSEMEWLERLSLLSCHSLEALPDMSKLHKLKHLKLINCSEIKDILGLSGLESLEELLIEKCEVLDALPNLSSLPKLKHLKLINCSEIKDILGLSGLESLEELLIENCEVLDTLPNLSSLAKLKILHLSFCKKVKNIHGVSELEELVIHNCHALDALPDLCKLQKLTKLELIFCEKLKDIHGVSELESLEELVIQNFDVLDSLRNLFGVQKLKNLKLIHCGKLKDIHDFSKLKSLEELVIQNFDVLDSLRNLSGLQKVKKLKLIHCEKLEGIHDFSELELELLEELMIQKFDVLDSCSRRYLSRLQKLKGRKLIHYEKLKDIYDFSELESLEEMAIQNFDELDSLRNLSGPQKLKKLKLIHCEKLKDIQDFSTLESLEELVIQDFDVLDTLPNLSGLQKLKKLKLIHCKKLEQIYMVINLKSLEELRIETCDALDALPHLYRLKNLKKLVLDKCQKLKDTRGIHELEWLELTITGCNSLDTSTLGRLKKLKRLKCYP